MRQKGSHMGSTLSSDQEQKLKVQPNRQRGGYSAELENFLQNRASLLGDRSNFGGLVAAIERGGSGGNRGTKGVGIIRIEPFENWDSMVGLHRAFDRDAKCERAFRILTTYERWLACARYVFRRDALPAGVIGQLGDLAVVAYVVADRLGIASRLALDASRIRTKQWESVCAIACEEMHFSWHNARAEVDREDAEVVEVDQ